MKNRHIEVWAPAANRVEIIADGRRAGLVPDPDRDGWWTDLRSHAAGTHYSFFLDGDGPFPDPRSASQPDGIHGLSSIVNHDEFQWDDGGWLPPRWEDAVIYELHVGTFSQEGTFEGVIGHLDALVELGVTYVELMPVVEFPGRRGWGYDGVSIFAPHREYGGPHGLKKLINACHVRGLAVLIDVVYNHLGPDGNYLPRFGPYFSGRHLTPWGEGPNLDGPQSAEVRRFFIDNALMWLRDYHADGLRLDAIDKVKDDSPVHFLAELRQAVDALDRPAILIAESAANDPLYVLPVNEGGRGMDAQWSDDMHHAIHSYLTGERESYHVDYGTLDQWAKALRQGFVYDGVLSEFRGATHGKPCADLPGSKFLAYLQTHDQVGNRAQGGRLHHLLENGIVLQQVAAAFVLLSPYIPMIFMGEEWAASSPFLYFTDHQDKIIAEAVSAGRKKEFGGSAWDSTAPDPQAEETFSRSRVIWSERTQGEHSQMLDWYIALLRLRRESPDFHTESKNEMEVACDPDGRWLSMKRGAHHVMAALANERVETRFDLPHDAEILMRAGDVSENESSRITFEGAGVVIFRLGLAVCLHRC